jgi:hypothetical protein
MHGNCPPGQLNGKKNPTRRNNQILRPSLGQAADIYARTYTRQKETTGYQMKTDAMANWPRKISY